jgi:hypothetical protein
VGGQAPFSGDLRSVRRSEKYCKKCELLTHLLIEFFRFCFIENVSFFLINAARVAIRGFTMALWGVSGGCFDVFLPFFWFDF